MLPTPIQNLFRITKIREAVPSRRGFIRYPPMYRSVHRRERLRMDVWHISRWPMVCLRLQEKMSMVRTAAANSVSRLDHYIASNGTLFNQKFHPSALSGRNGLENFVGLIRSYFDQKGSHMQFNVVSRETLLDAQKHPEQYKHLVVRVAGYSALFTTLSKSLQDDIIRRTEQGF